jgi:hypothetical protein
VRMRIGVGLDLIEAFIRPVDTVSAIYHRDADALTCVMGEAF